MHQFITIFELSIPSWTILALFGVFLCWFLFYFRSRTLGYDYREIFNFFVYGMPVGFIGATSIQYITIFLTGSNQDIGFDGSMTVTGAIISLCIYAYVYSRWILKLNPLAFMDQIAFTFPLTILVGRIGCLFEGCCYGHAHDLENYSFFTMQVSHYEPASVAYQHYMHIGLDTMQTVWNLPLMMVLASFIVLVGAEVFYKYRIKLKLPNGFIALITLWLYSALRLIIENFRLEDKIELVPFNPWQTIVFFIFVFSTVSLVVLTTNIIKINVKNKVPLS